MLGNLGTYFKHRTDQNYSSLGASGAILAVLFASIVYFPGQRLFIIPIPVPIPAPLFALGYLAYSYYSARQARGKINHDAHIGGAITIRTRTGPCLRPCLIKKGPGRLESPNARVVQFSSDAANLRR